MMTNRRRSAVRCRRLSAVLCPFVLLLLWAGVARAHQSSVVYSEIAADGREVAYTLQISNSDLYEALGLSRDRPATVAEVQAGQGRIEAYVLARVRVDNNGLSCPGAVEGRERADKADGFFVVLRLRYRCARTLEDARIRYDLFFDLDPRHQGLAHVIAFGNDSEFVFRERGRVLSLSRHLTALDNARDYLELGVEHIFTGYDHLGFLFCLLVVAGAISGERRGRAGARAGAAYVVRVVTAFTLAHSVTLIASALGRASVPGRLVESLIAASIAYVALENILRARPRHRFLLTFCFGLVHGFGFASVLKEIGLPKAGLLLSLLSFNLGVELGQLLVVALVYPVLHVLAERGAGAVARGAGAVARGAGDADPGAGYRPAELVLVAVLSAVAVVVLSRFGLPWGPLCAVALGTPAVLLALVPVYGYAGPVQRGCSAVLLLLSMLWLGERVSGVTLLGGALG